MPANPKGLGIERLFTEQGVEPFDLLEWKKRDTVIRNYDGTIAFEMQDVNLPTNYSQILPHATPYHSGIKELGVKFETNI